MQFNNLWLHILVNEYYMNVNSVVINVICLTLPIGLFFLRELTSCRVWTRHCYGAVLTEGYRVAVPCGDRMDCLHFSVTQ